jgi:hypothetical protein
MITAPEPPFIETVSSDVRKVLVVERVHPTCSELFK